MKLALEILRIKLNVTFSKKAKSAKGGLIKITIAISYGL